MFAIARFIEETCSDKIFRNIHRFNILGLLDIDYILIDLLNSYHYFWFFCDFLLFVLFFTSFTNFSSNFLCFIWIV